MSDAGCQLKGNESLMRKMPSGFHAETEGNLTNQRRGKRSGGRVGKRDVDSEWQGRGTPVVSTAPGIRRTGRGVLRFL